MKVALGIKPHSGWAAAVAIGQAGEDLTVVDRRRIELADEAWAKQPYHAAEGLRPEEARDVVKRGVEAAHEVALREMRAALKRELQRKTQVAACAVIVGNPMPDWSTDEILAVHFRMHAAEGVLFRDALAAAAKACGVALVTIPEKRLATQAEQAFGSRTKNLTAKVAALGKLAGPPWGKDQKDAALAALIALKTL